MLLWLLVIGGGVCNEDYCYLGCLVGYDDYVGDLVEWFGKNLEVRFYN